MKDEISTEELIACAKAASKEAEERAKVLKIPYTVQEGKSIVRYNPGGRKRSCRNTPESLRQTKGKMLSSRLIPEPSGSRYIQNY